MSDRPRLPSTFVDWVRVFGPGAIMASLTIGTGELIFSSRGGALFGYHILFVFSLISLLKWALVFGTSRHMVLTGVHPYERMLEFPGPRGWLLIMLLLMSIACMPIWISFHSGVLGNLSSWVTGTRGGLHGGVDYLWGAGILAATAILSFAGGYTVLERVQMAVVLAMVFCSGLTLLLYRPDWLEMLAGLLPSRLSYPEWVSGKYPEIARHSVWVETTRYVGVIGGAGFDYLAYTSWLREKQWGVLPDRATPEQLAEIAANPNHEVRRWIRAPLIDCAISFLMVVAFSAVFVASGAMFLGPAETVPDEENMLNLQARFVTQIHPILLPLYVMGAFLTMLGTLYGTIEIACTIADEICRTLSPRWTALSAKRLRRGILIWSISAAMVILLWLFVRQTMPAGPVATAASPASADASSHSAAAEPSQAPLQKPRLLLAILTPVNLFTGVLSCGLLCLLIPWMDRRWLPPGLQPSWGLRVLHAVAAVSFIALGIKGYWDNENRAVAAYGMLGIVAVALLVASVMGPGRVPAESISTDGEPAS